MRRFATLTLTIFLSCSATGAARASSLVTLDVGTAAAWQADCIVIGFDDVPGTLSFVPGFVVPAASQLTDQFVQCAGVAFASTGGPIAVIGVAGTPQAGDAQSPPNIIGGTILSGPNIVINYLQSIHLELVNGSGAPAPSNKVGAWTDPTGSLVRLDVFDSAGQLLESAQGNQGFFIGVEHEGIASATFVFVHQQSAAGFSLDDVSIGRRAGSADLNGDGIVNGADLGLLLGAWGPCPSNCCVADVDSSGGVDGADLGLLLGAWS
ncbi:MAG: hypothetical protein U0575_05385 [Phycisphaerales bacterium]